MRYPDLPTFPHYPHWCQAPKKAPKRKLTALFASKLVRANSHVKVGSVKIR